ncbi:MAG TPA: hypothetical protein VFH77_09335 [Streptomyces sp.]|nr:hypothetical protein [Streptomyces sp.]
MRDNGEIWGTPFKPWQWAEVFALIVVIGVVRLEGDVFDDRTPRVVAGLVLLGLFVHIVIWIVPVLRRRL